MSYISLNSVKILWMPAVFRIRFILMRIQIRGSASGNSGSDQKSNKFQLFLLNVFLSLLFMCTNQKSVLITIFLATRIRIHISWSGSETLDANLISFLSKTGGTLALLFCGDMRLILTLLRHLQLDLHHPQNQPWTVLIKLTTLQDPLGGGSWLFWSSYCTGQRIID